MVRTRTAIGWNGGPSGALINRLFDEAVDVRDRALATLSDAKIYCGSNRAAVLRETSFPLAPGQIAFGVLKGSRRGMLNVSRRLPLPAASVPGAALYRYLA